MSEHGWDHAICAICWKEQNPNRRATALAKPYIEVCCWCGIIHISGIYVHQEPDSLPFCHLPSADTLAMTVELMNVHVENLIERVAELEGRS